ncbi:hypothetical protein [Rhodococcus sp. (in: high G+C Gram-positive bacteria)]|uniref:hypothetical protein n=1 Tax=Rhodococcus sp. TaxID=1831 RepID=UPI002588F3BA|nr:hypothetical protein [Rhodococcus sp. (in: high G+C Gram-positive bacteria)]
MFTYTVAAIPVAMLALLHPILADAAMAFSSVFGSSNSLVRRRPWTLRDGGSISGSQESSGTDTAVGLVLANLRVNGYVAVAEYPVLEATGRGSPRTLTDLDILAMRPRTRR